MVSLTDAPHFETRFYLYESDLLYTFSVPPSSGKNIRYYLLLRYLITSQIQGRIKWAQTRYYDRQSIGTGADTIDGPVRSDLKLQLVYRFRR